MWLNLFELLNVVDDVKSVQRSVFHSLPHVAQGNTDVNDAQR